MSRCGDLLQRESLIQGAGDRQMVQNMANELGRALEELAKATAGTAHLYRNLNVGPTVGQ
jgi:hypothetical protein